MTLQLLRTPPLILPSKHQNSVWSGALTLNRHGSNSQLLSLHQNEPEITGLFYSATVRLHTWIHAECMRVRLRNTLHVDNSHLARLVFPYHLCTYSGQGINAHMLVDFSKAVESSYVCALFLMPAPKLWCPGYLQLLFKIVSESITLLPSLCHIFFLDNKEFPPRGSCC